MTMLTAAPIFHRLKTPFVIGCMCLMLAACGTKNDVPATESTQQSSNAGQVKGLVYGVSCDIPTGWVVSRSMDANTMSNADLDARVTGKEPLQILHLYRPTADGQGATGQIAVFLVDSTKSFIPENEAKTRTQKDFDDFSAYLLDQDKKIAAQKKTQNTTIEWNITRSEIDGRLAILTKGLGKRPGGTVRALEANIYLPNNKGVAVKCMGFQEIENNDAVLQQFLASLKIAR